MCSLAWSVPIEPFIPERKVPITPVRGLALGEVIAQSGPFRIAVTDEYTKNKKVGREYRRSTVAFVYTEGDFEVSRSIAVRLVKSGSGMQQVKWCGDASPNPRRFSYHQFCVFRDNIKTMADPMTVSAELLSLVENLMLPFDLLSIVPGGEAKKLYKKYSIVNGSIVLASREITISLGEPLCGENPADESPAPAGGIGIDVAATFEDFRAVFAGLADLIESDIATGTMRMRAIGIMDGWRPHMHVAAVHHGVWSGETTDPRKTTKKQAQVHGLPSCIQQ